ncbi:hypothetical protein [Rhodococcoides fascians]|uniref:hypothetical protein n=1 Tax=Rhodococcoides fascians TaxID=1828 RepID=UPI00056951E5|nr:hypothetical protein [Rhodococcus fascians]
MSNPEQSVIDQIDALIDEQLDAGEPIGGYDYDDPDYPECPRCTRQWHGLPEGNCIGSGIEGPDTPPCPHCGRQWHAEPGGYYARCPGSTFIGPRRPGPFEEARDADGYLPNVTREIQTPLYTAPLGTPLPTDDVFDLSAWSNIGVVAPRPRYTPPRRSPWVDLLYRNLLDLASLRSQIEALGGTWDESWSTRDARAHRDQLMSGAVSGMSVNEGISFASHFGGLMNYTESLHGRPYDWCGGQSGARTTFTEIDEHREAYERMSKILTWTNPFLPNDYAQREPRPWLYVPRRRVIPAYTYEANGFYVTWDRHGQRSGLNYRVTGTLPEYVDATMDTTGPIPPNYLDADRQTWTVRRPQPGLPNPFSASFFFDWGILEATWTVTVGENDANHIPPEIAAATTPEQPPMWTVNPGRERRRNTRRRHR